MCVDFLQACKYDMALTKNQEMAEASGSSSSEAASVADGLGRINQNTTN